MAAPLEEAAPLLEEAAAMCTGTICGREGWLPKLAFSTQTLQWVSLFLHALFLQRRRLGVLLGQPNGSG